MRIALAIFGSAVAVTAGWGASSVAQPESSYDGPQYIRFRSNGMLAPTLDGSVDLVAGTADVVGPCGRGVGYGASCTPTDRRHLSISNSNLATFRSLAVEVKSKGLFDANCIEDLKKKNQINEMKQRKEAEEKRASWMKSHPKFKGTVPRTPIVPPLDPYSASLTIDGIGSVFSSPEVGGEQSESAAWRKQQRPSGTWF